MKPYAEALQSAARARAERTGLDADTLALPPPGTSCARAEAESRRMMTPGTCAAVAAAAQRMRAGNPTLLALSMNQIADDLAARHSPEALRMLAGALQDRAAGRYGVHPDTLRREGGL
jgi:hypothetical protein